MTRRILSPTVLLLFFLIIIFTFAQSQFEICKNNNHVSSYWKGENNEDEMGRNKLNMKGVEIVEGVFGNCFYFSKDTYLEVDTVDSTNFPKNDFSISFWVNMEPGSHYRAGLFSYISREKESQEIAIKGYSPIGVILNDEERLSNAELNSGEWTHILVIYSSETKSLVVYRNGEENHINDFYDKTFQPSGTLVFGQLWKGNGEVVSESQYLGRMDEIIIFNRTLNPREIEILVSGDIFCFGKSSKEPDVCSGKGVCALPDVCVCEVGFAGCNCESWTCNGIGEKDPNVCNGNGVCTAPDKCECKPGYEGEFCEKFLCFGKEGDDGCSNNGQCTGPDTCKCNDGWTGPQCEIAICFGKLANDSNVCSGRGTCNAPNDCKCSSGWAGNECQTPVCFGKTENSACSHPNGVCTAPDTCTCQPGFQGSQCESFHCNDRNNCSPNGVCVGPNQCKCNDGWTGVDCDVAICFGKLANDSNVCSGRGTCNAPDVCICSGSWTGNECQIPICFGKSENSACSHPNGVCTAPDTCACQPGFQGSECESFHCNDRNNCSSNGACIGPNQCQCNDGWTGVNCDIPICFGKLANDSNVCSGHGTCNAPNDCKCSSSWTGNECQTPVCFGKSENSACSYPNGTCTAPDTCACQPGFQGSQCESFHCNDRNNCSPNGVCVGPNVCKCNDGWTGDNCDIPICFGIPGNDLSVCSGRGECISNNTCKCQGSYSGLQCEFSECMALNNCSNNGICLGLNNCSCFEGWKGADCSQFHCEALNNCNGKGECVGPSNCSCITGYGGADCNLPICYGISNPSLVCSGRGSCVAPNQCVCNANYYGPQCELNICFGKLSNDSTVCSGNGNCTATNECSCHNGWTGNECELPICFGKSANDPSVCNGKGDCIAPNHCQCSTNWTGSNCDIPICYGIPGNESSVCSGRGKCTQNFTCDCFGNGFTGDQCQFSMCEELNNCTNNGVCVGVNNCSCYSGWHGEKCDVFNCIGVNNCSDKGVCIGPNNCSCSDGWTGSDCNLAICNGKAANDPSVCNGRGTCSSPDNCTCTGDYTGADCEVYYCFGKNQSDPNVCSSNGKCESPNQCVCNEGYGGLTCEQFCPVGEMLNATFTIDGHIVIKFNHKVNISKIGNDCSDLFINNAFGNQSICTFVDELTLDITLGDSFSVRIGDYLILKNNSIIIQSDCQSFVNGRIRVDPPPNLVIVKPTVILEGPPKLSACQDLLLDASSSFASTPLTFYWNLIQSSDFVYSPDIMTLIQSLKSPKIEIPNHMFTINGKYNFEVTIVDRFGQSDKSSIIVEFVNSGYVPHVNIKGPSTITINAGEELLLEGTASFSQCVDVTGMKLEYIWSNEGTILPSQGGNLYIERYKLTPGIYTFNLLVNLVNIETNQIVESVTTSVEVKVNESPVQARIRGAMNRQVPSISTIPFVLDGSESRDLGLPNVPSNAVYIWKCCKRNGDICDFKEGALAFPDLEGTTSSKYSRIGSITSPLPTGTFEFYLTFQVGTKSDTTSITVQFVNENIPIIFIEQLETQNQNRPLRLFGKVTTDSKQLLFKWTSIEGNIDLSDPKIVPYGDNRQELYIEKGNLLNSKYVFRLYVTTEDGSGYADTTIFVNQAPIGGTLSIQPTQATSLDYLTLSTTNWKDDPTDFPLQYTFYRKQESDFGQIWIPLNLYPQFSNEIKFRAPIVSVPTKYTFMVEAVDKRGAKGQSMEVDIAIYPLNNNMPIESFISDLISKNLTRSHLEGDYESVLDLITQIGDLFKLHKSEISESNLRVFVKQIFEIFYSNFSFRKMNSNLRIKLSNILLQLVSTAELDEDLINQLLEMASAAFIFDDHSITNEEQLPYSAGGLAIDAISKLLESNKNISTTQKVQDIITKIGKLTMIDKPSGQSIHFNTKHITMIQSRIIFNSLFGNPVKLNNASITIEQGSFDSLDSSHNLDLLDVRIIEWNHNPYPTNQTKDMNSNVISYDLIDGDGKDIKISHSNQPILITIPTINTSKKGNVYCRYFNPKTQEWEDVEVYKIEETQVICSTNHLTDFATFVQEGEDDTSTNYLKYLWFLVLILPLIAVITLVIALIIVTKRKKRREEQAQVELNDIL